MKTPPIPSATRYSNARYSTTEYSATRSAPAPLPAPLRYLAATVPVLLALLMLAALTGCGGGLLGGGNVGGRPDQAQIHGDVERVEAYADEIDIRTDDQRIVTVGYDANTAVYWQGRTYEPSNLEPGDVISVDVVQASSGRWLAQRIDVEQSNQDRVGGPVGGDDGGVNGELTSLEGAVRDVDTSQRRITLDTGRSDDSFFYRSGTVVYYQGDRYAVDNLEPGDVISARVERDYRGDWVTDTITVEESRQDRTGNYDGGNDDRNGTATGQRYAGTVDQVDSRRGEFVLRTERYGTQTVVMPYDASSADRRQFEGLRKGDYVRLEGDPQQSGRIELIRFGWSTS